MTNFFPLLRLHLCSASQGADLYGLPRVPLPFAFQVLSAGGEHRETEKEGAQGGDSPGSFPAGFVESDHVSSHGDHIS